MFIDELKKVLTIEKAKTSIFSFLKCKLLVIGRFVPELDLLAKELDGGSRSCGNPLHLADCTQEMISGLGSFLYITCGEESCSRINVPHKYSALSEYGHPRKTSV